MKKSLIYSVVSCLIISALLLMSCATEELTEEEVISIEEREGTIMLGEEAEVAEVEAEMEKEEAEDKTKSEGETVSLQPMLRGAMDPEITVDIYEIDKAYTGTTLLADNHNLNRPRIIEVNMLGEIVWEYLVPQNIKGYVNPGFDTELLPNNNVLFVLPCNGVYEVSRNGEVVWSCVTDKISHDADRLLNGNTIFVFGANDQKSDSQVIEVNQQGDIIWRWNARDDFNIPPYSTVSNEGWTHTNSVTRMPNGNTLISPRNFSRLIEVDESGEVIRIIGDGVVFQNSDVKFNLMADENTDPFSPHDPEILPDGNILMVSQYWPMRAIEMVPETGEIVWEYIISARDNWPVRDADRLPNGNTLITGAKMITEVTTEGEIVWQLSLGGVTFQRNEGPSRGFYKAERINGHE
ncbi:aryl-sulfate sulfotransferase [Chloroflexota bacterium]